MTDDSAALPHHSVTDAGDRAALAKGASLNLAGRIFGQGIQFSLQVVLARLLGPAAFGSYSIGWILVRMAGGLVAPLGLDEGILRFSAVIKDRDSSAFGRLLRSGVGVAVLAGAVMGVLVLGLARVIAETVYRDPALAPVLRAFAPAFALIAGLRVASAATRITQRMVYSIVCEEIAQPIAQCALIVAVCLAGGGAAAAAGATSVSLAVAFGLAVVFATRLFPSTIRSQSHATERMPLVSDLIRFSLPTMAGGLALSLLTWVDQLIVGVYGSTVDVSIYRCASICAIVLSVILSAFNSMVSSQIAALHYGGERERLASLFRASGRWGLYVGVPPFLVLCFAPTEVLSIFGVTYEQGSRSLIILASAHLAHVIAGPAAPTLVLTGAPGLWTLLTVAVLAANLIMNVIWIPQYGAVGAATARAVALAGLVSGCLLLVKVRLGFWPWDRRFLKGLLAGIGTAGALWLLRGSFSGPPLLRLASVGAVGTTLFVALVATSGLDSDDRAIIQAALRRLGVTP